MVHQPTATLDQAALARTAADALAGLLPSAVPLTVVDHDPATGPAADATAVRATHVGALSVEVVVVADQAVAQVLADAATPISVADALRPALEAAAATFGPGVLDEARPGPLAGALDEPDVSVVALAPASGPTAGVPQAWVAVRVLRATEAVPHQRGPSAPVHSDQRTALRLLHDVEMTLTAEIGRTRMPVRQVLDLAPGVVLELDRAAGSPADVMVNGRLVARGEVVVIDEDYGVRITEIVAAENA